MASSSFCHCLIKLEAHKRFCCPAQLNRETSRNFSAPLDNKPLSLLYHCPHCPSDLYPYSVHSLHLAYLLYCSCKTTMVISLLLLLLLLLRLLLLLCWVFIMNFNPHIAFALSVQAPNTVQFSSRAVSGSQNRNESKRTIKRYKIAVAIITDQQQ